MSGIYFGEHIRLKSYTATTRCGKSSIRINLDVTDPYGLASVLRQLDEIDAAQQAAAKPKPVAKKPAKQLALPAPRLALPYFPED